MGCTGHVPGPVARHFGLDPGALRGIGQIAWPVSLYSTLGYDWRTELLNSGHTTDARCLDQNRFLSFPDIFTFSSRRHFFAGHAYLLRIDGLRPSDLNRVSGCSV